uniref:cadherin-related family member 5 n=1 Tax=Semicossyphus pulcher TaxID=241346 RepID=UPI0037E95638
METHFTVTTGFSFLLLILLQSSAEAQICSAATNLQFAENNTAGAVVTSITVQPGVTLALTTNPDNSFRLEGNNLIADKVFDFENVLPIVVVLTGINDNPPNFAENLYNINVEEMSPVGTTAGPTVGFPATDLDEDILFYTLTSESSAFKLQSSTSPILLVETPLEYDKVKNVQLILKAQDTPFTSEGGSTATTTINVAILDVDNRPPWFQPCTPQDTQGSLVCQSAGYTGRVVLNEQETGALQLKPGRLHAIDGDSGINEEIVYSFVGGDAGGLFAINSNTGNVTMLKPADKLGLISLTVLAAQKINRNQFATTTITIQVQVESLHPPKFQKPRYEGIISAVGMMAMDSGSTSEPLQILATDYDYNATAGLNPHITYSIVGSSDFSVINRFLFMTKDVPDGTLSLQVEATDTSNDEKATAQLSVEVKSGVTTTSLPLTTTDSTATTSIGESTTDSKTTEDAASTTDSIVTTTIPSTTSESSISTTASMIVPSGGFGPADMAALGATLGVLLFICVVVIVVLALRVQRGKEAWKKIYETSMFKSTLGQGSGGPKEGIQFTNDAFMKDEDGDGSIGPDGGSGKAGVEPQKAAGNFMLEEAIVKSTVPFNALLRDDVSEADSDKTDDKDVKPILTKERRMDDGYKSVWFKEDIVPDANEEVVIIPESREDDSDEDEEEQSSSDKEDNEDDNLGMKAPRVVFNDSDLDSGMGVNMEDPAEDRESGEALTLSL